MSGLIFRYDDYSFQITLQGSPFFFIRVTSSAASKANLVFSDFILEGSENSLAVEALRLVKTHFHGPAPNMRIVFKDIHPSYRDEKGYTEVVRRHDKIVAVVREYASQTGLKIRDSFLEPSAGKFETVVLIE